MAQSTLEYHKTNATNTSERTPIRVLHVDNDASFLDAAKPLLEMQGPFQIATASSTEEATEKIKENNYDAIICDYVMPGKDGLQFLKQLRDTGNNIPFIVFTGKGREEIVIKALNLGADYYINKIGNPETVYSELAHSIRKTVKAKQAEEALKESEEKYRNLVELAPDSIMTFDMKGTITSANTASTLLSGYSKDELVGKNFTKIGPIRARDIPKYLQMLTSTLRGNVPKPFQVIYHHKDGTQRLGEVRFSFIKERGKTVGLQAIMRDTTESRKAEEAVKESEEKFKNIFESAGDGLIYLDTFGRIIDINTQAAEFLGGPKEEAIGKHFTKIGLFTIKDIPTLMKNFASILRGKKATLNVTVKNKKGQVIPLECSATLLKVNDKSTIAVIARDITERKKTLEKLKVLNEKLGVVGGLTRHDIRNKLFAITNNIYLAKQTLPNDHKAHVYLASIESLVQQTTKILDFASIYEKLGVEELTPTDVEKSVKEAVTLISDMHGVRVINECHGLKVMADSLLRQLIYNLIDNSLKHGGKVTQIKIHYKEEDNNYKLVYEDDGIGIPKTEKNKIFNKDHQKDQKHGLFMIQKMCEVYGWTIQETGTQGKGAQFTITIPKTSEPKT